MTDEKFTPILRIFRGLTLCIGASLLSTTVSALPDSCGVGGNSYNAIYRPDAPPIAVEYEHVKKEVGERLTIGDNQYVMVRIPFADLVTGDRYAISYPAIAFSAPHSLEPYASVHPHLNSDGVGCSDVAVAGGSSPTHPIPVLLSASVGSHGMNQERQLRTQSSASAALFFRTQSTEIMINIDARIKGSADCLNGKPMHPGVSADAVECDPIIASGDYDLVDDVDFDKLTGSTDLLIKALDELIDYVFVEPLTSVD